MTISPDLLRPGVFILLAQRENGVHRSACIVNETRSGHPIACLAASTRRSGAYWTKPITILKQDFTIERLLDAAEIEALITTHGDPPALDA